MSMNNFPPQAYTRDTLSAAYQWLRDQPGSIRELAQDSDSLVALFMQARRRPAGYAQAQQQTMTTAQDQNLASAEHFKEDLKVLAQGLKQFEVPKQKSFVQPQQAQSQAHTQPQQAPRYDTFTRTEAVTRTETIQRPEQPQVHSPNMIVLDAKSYDIVVDIQDRLNLSTPLEAVRMLITLGAERVRDILPKNGG
ncbi:MAG: hypothetical protein KDD38_02245 [Bdellovibrionales bacterium]|nr:hypothetical protein [Bdellovibrionales bacterium]